MRSRGSRPQGSRFVVDARLATDEGDDNIYDQILGRSPRLSYLDGLEPNHNYAGFVTFEIPADMNADLTLVYAPSFLTTTYEIPLS